MSDKIGILELANAYMNLSGFFSYTKVGFDKDNSLFGKYCFNDASNLPMSVDITKYSNADIIGMVTDTKKRDPTQIKDGTGIYELGLPDKNIKSEVETQALIAKISSLKHMMDVDYKKVQSTLSLKSFKDSIVDKKNFPKNSTTETQEKLAVQEYLNDVKSIYKKQLDSKKTVCIPKEDNAYCVISGGKSRTAFK